MDWSVPKILSTTKGNPEFCLFCLSQMMQTATANTTTSVSTVWWRISWKPCVTASPTCTIILSWNVQTWCNFSLVSSLTQKKQMLLSTAPLVSVSPLLLLCVKVCFESLPSSLDFYFRFARSSLVRSNFREQDLTLCIQFFKCSLDAISNLVVPNLFWLA